MVVVMFADTEGMKLVAAKSDLEYRKGQNEGKVGKESASQLQRTGLRGNKAGMSRRRRER